MMVSENILKDIFKNSRTIAVVGLSPKPDRPSHGVTKYLIESGYDIYGVNPDARLILGRPSFPTLLEVPRPVDIVDVFRKSEAVPDIADQAIQIGAKVLWLQEGVSHPESEARAQKAGLIVVSNACILKVRRRLFP